MQKINTSVTDMHNGNNEKVHFNLNIVFLFVNYFFFNYSVPQLTPMRYKVYDHTRNISFLV